MKTMLFLAGLAFTFAAPAANWPQWRGPNFDGSSPETGLPEKFSKTENVVWTAPMPGPSGSTPVIWGDYVFVASTDQSDQSCMALAFDRKTGQQLWRVKVAAGMGQDRNSTYSNSSPLTDGKRVWFFFATGDLVCLDLLGKDLWRRNIQKDYGDFAYQWTYGASPLLYDGRLYVVVLQRNVPMHGRGRQNGESYLLALAPDTGKELWKVVRPSEAAAESLEAYSTPMPYTHQGRTELIITGGDCISGHDPISGKEFWRWGTWNPTRIGHWRLVPSATAGSGIALVCGPKGAPVYAVKLGGNGNLPNSSLAWQSYVQSTEIESKAAPSLNNREITSDVPTPLFYKGRFYILNGDRRTKFLTSLDPVTGKVFWSGELQSTTIQATPTAADDKIYIMNWPGDVFVIQAGGDEFKLLHTAAMGDGENMLRAAIPITRGNCSSAHRRRFIALGKSSVPQRRLGQGKGVVLLVSWNPFRRIETARTGCHRIISGDRYRRSRGTPPLGPTFLLRPRPNQQTPRG
jgi:outer membrane protein assembly factor BamB